jgi:tRNA 2-thiouridine synthesizing protein A
MSDFTLDVRRLLCPLPVIRLQTKIQSLESGTAITVIASDPGVMEDIPVWCRLNGHIIKKIERKEREIWIEMIKG